ncbi:MAG: zinc-binding dehydrogenase, partial [Cyclobacteriaceae bacterium]
SEVNENRVKKAVELGLNAVNPSKIDLEACVREETDGRLADVVFEVAGVQPALDIMTELAGIRGRILMVAIHGQKREVDLFKFFWKELKLIGARVYEKEDYEKSIALITANELPFEDMITDIQPLTNIQKVFEEIDNNPDGLKVLMDCQM